MTTPMPGERAAVRLLAKAADAGVLAPVIEAQAPPRPATGQALVRVEAAGVNPSDVKAALGLMPQAVFPRSPGRDYAGTVVDGPAEWMGREVWGSGGDLGITRDGSHAAWLLLPIAALRDRPARLSFDEAGSVGVPFVTAYEGLRRAGLFSGAGRRAPVVAVMGANGKVGQAAVQLAAQAGARVVAVQRAPAHGGFAAADVAQVDARSDDVAARVREAGDGRGADIVFNTVGSPYFATANQALAKDGTQIFIATVERSVPFDIFTFYRGMHTYVGIDTLALDCVASAERMDAMRAGFDAGTLRPFALSRDATYALADALTAYRRVLGGDAQRVVLKPSCRETVKS